MNAEKHLAQWGSEFPARVGRAKLKRGLVHELEGRQQDADNRREHDAHADGEA